MIAADITTDSVRDAPI